VFPQVEVLEEGIKFSSHGDRHKIAPWGWNGGLKGRTGRFTINHKESLPSKNSGISLKKNDVVTIETPGGGGFGDPTKRLPDLKQIDQEEGKLSW
jgi:N-methylhydantoinase B